MRFPTRWFVVSFVVYAVTGVLKGDPRQLTPGAPAVRVTVDNVSVLDLAQDHLQLSFLLTFLSDADVSVRQIVFDNVRMNEMPLYVAPVAQKFALKANQPQQLPEALRLTLYFRDLNSVRPLQTALLDKRVRLEGTVYLDGELPVLIKLLLLGRRVRVPVTFRQDIPLNVPDNQLLQSVATRALNAAGASLNALSGLTEGLLRRSSTWREDLWKNIGPSLLLAYVRFSLRTKEGEQLSYEFTGTGFRISPRQFVLCKSLVEPWKFDPDIASAVKFSELKLDQSTYDVWVWPVDARIRDASNELVSATAFRLGQSDFRRIAQPPDQNVSFYALQPEGRPKKMALHRRDSPANLVLFEFRNPPNFLGEFKRSLGDRKAWDRVAVFRFPGGVNEGVARADLVFVPASREASKIRLEIPVDSSAWGSPIVTQEGIIGLLQDQTAAVPLKDAFNALKVK